MKLKTLFLFLLFPLQIFAITTGGTVLNTTPFSRTILDDVNASSVRETIGVTDIINDSDFQNDAISFLSFVSAEPSSPTVGDRYINSATGTSSSTSQSVTQYYIYTWNGASWDEISPREGTVLTVTGVNEIWIFNGSGWTNLGTYTNHNFSADLQGGGAGEYYHFTEGEHTTLNAIIDSGYAVAMDQSVAQASTPLFDGLSSSGDINLNPGDDHVRLNLTTIGSTKVSRVRFGGHDGSNYWYLGKDANNRFGAIYGTGIGDSNGIVIEPGGFVGIGITDSTHRLHVSAAATEAVRIQSSQNEVELRFSPNTSILDARIGADASTSSANLYFKTSGSERVRIYNDGGVTVGSPTGGSKGAGTINAVGVYDDDSLLSDHVFEKYYLGYAKDKRHKNFKMNTLEDEIDFVKSNLHLSTIIGRSEWENSGKQSLGKLVTQLWETVEVQHLYITQLNERIKKLEKNKEAK